MNYLLDWIRTQDPSTYTPNYKCPASQEPVIAATAVAQPIATASAQALNSPLSLFGRTTVQQTSAMLPSASTTLAQESSRLETSPTTSNLWGADAVFPALSHENYDKDDWRAPKTWFGLL